MSDPKPAKRIKDPTLVKNFSLRAGSCAVCGEGRAAGLQAHHVYHRGRGGDDCVPNLVALCLSCHDAYHGGNRETRLLLGQHICLLRDDTLEYLGEKMGQKATLEFLAREIGVAELLGV